MVFLLPVKEVLTYSQARDKSKIRTKNQKKIVIIRLQQMGIHHHDVKYNVLEFFFFSYLKKIKKIKKLELGIVSYACDCT